MRWIAQAGASLQYRESLTDPAAWWKRRCSAFGKSARSSAPVHIPCNRDWGVEVDMKSGLSNSTSPPPPAVVGQLPQPAVQFVEVVPLPPAAQPGRPLPGLDQEG